MAVAFVTDVYILTLGVVDGALAIVDEENLSDAIGSPLGGHGGVRRPCRSNRVGFRTGRGAFQKQTWRRCRHETKGETMEIGEVPPWFRGRVHFARRPSPNGV